MEDSRKYLRRRKQGEEGPSEIGSRAMSFPVWPGHGAPARKCRGGGQMERPVPLY